MKPRFLPVFFFLFTGISNFEADAQVAGTCGDQTLNAVALLGGALISNGVMNSTQANNLRLLPDFPLTEPYSGRSGYLTNPGGETTTTDVLAISGADAVVDWILIELRDKTDPTKVVRTAAGLLQVDGDIVAPSGSGPLVFKNLEDDSYFVSVRHRNHLGVMTATPIPFVHTTTSSIDFTSSSLDVYNLTSPTNFDGNERYVLGSGVTALWWGDANADGQIEAQTVGGGTGSDPTAIQNAVMSAPGNILSSPSYIYPGYRDSDINLSGTTIFQGQNNDVDDIYNSVILNPLNGSNDPAFQQHLIQLPAVTSSTTTYDCTPLPVTLINFKAVKENSIAVLNWLTSEETNSDRFEVERSINGKIWSKIGIVSSHGESTVVRNYRFEDSTPIQGNTNLYRLKMVDKDLTFAYSQIQAIKLDGNLVDFSIYPNPSSDKLNIREYANVKEIVISDLNGRSVYQSASFSNGNGTVDIKNLAQGMYIIKLTRLNGEFSTYKVLVNK